MGCSESKAKAWAFRCHLEMQQHQKAAFITLTYAPKHEPVTLSKRHFRLWLKRLRVELARSAPDRRVRFFGCGEYGEQRGRPHYHAIVFGLGNSEEEKALVQKTWPYGIAQTLMANPGAMAYVAGYTDKKKGDLKKAQIERVDPSTGEVYQWQPPFIQMSKKPGIGGEARTEFTQSWGKEFAVLNGKKQTVPRFLLEAWKKTATPEQLENHKMRQEMKLEQIAMTKEQRKAKELEARAKQEIKRARRTKI